MRLQLPHVIISAFLLVLLVKVSNADIIVFTFSLPKAESSNNDVIPSTKQVASRDVGYANKETADTICYSLIDDDDGIQRKLVNFEYSITRDKDSKTPFAAPIGIFFYEDSYCKTTKEDNEIVLPDVTLLFSTTLSRDNPVKKYNMEDVMIINQKGQYVEPTNEFARVYKSFRVVPESQKIDVGYLIKYLIEDSKEFIMATPQGLEVRRKMDTDDWANMRKVPI